MPTMPRYPSPVINITDNSIYEFVENEVMPVGKQLYFVQSAKGEVNIPKWYDEFVVAQANLGEETFIVGSDYYDIESKFIETVMQNCGCWIVRLADEAANSASLVVEAVVTTGVDVIQYQKDAYNGRVVDENGDPVPIDNEGSPLTEPGISIEWNVRALEDGEDYTTIQPVTVDNTTTYPVLILIAISPGVWGNKAGFRLSYDYSTQDSMLNDDIGSIMYTLRPITIEYGNTSPTSVRDQFNNQTVEFTLKPNQVDEATASNVSMSEVLSEHYNDAYPLPFDMFAYTEYIKDIGDLIYNLEKDFLTDLPDGWGCDIFTATDYDGHPYDHVTMVTSGDAVMFSDSINHYMTGGDDGTTTRTAFEERIRNYLDLSTYPQVQDTYRYPITHLIDPGYTLDTKYKYLEFMAVNEAIMVTVSTQDITNNINLEANDYSAANALRTRALLMRESIVKGTGCCRASVVGHAGKLLDTSYSDIVPLTLEIADKLAKRHNVDYMKDTIAGRPKSEVSLFNIETLNWTAYTDDSRSRNWDARMIYVQYADRDTVFFPYYRTVYSYDTSALVGYEFVCFLCYLKLAVNKVWTKYSGTDAPFADISTAIREDLTYECNRLANGKYAVTPSVYQTEDEKKIGYITHIGLNIVANNGQRVWDVDMIVTRETYDSAA